MQIALLHTHHKATQASYFFIEFVSQKIESYHLMAMFNQDFFSSRIMYKLLLKIPD